MESQNKFRAQWKLPLVQAPLLQLTLLKLEGQGNGSGVKALTQEAWWPVFFPPNPWKCGRRVVLCPLCIHVLAHPPHTHTNAHTLIVTVKFYKIGRTPKTFVSIMPTSIYCFRPENWGKVCKSHCLHCVLFCFVLFFVLFLCLFVYNRISCSSGWPWIYRDAPSSASSTVSAVLGQVLLYPGHIVILNDKNTLKHILTQIMFCEKYNFKNKKY